MAGVARGQSTWNLNSNGTWGTAGNWSPSGIPSAVDANVTFGSVITANRSIDVGNRTVGFITFNDNNNYTLTTSGTLTLDVSSGSAWIYLPAANTGTHTIARPITLNDALIITNQSTGGLTISGIISGSQTVSLVGSGTNTVTFSGNNSFTGNLSLDNVKLVASSNVRFGNNANDISLSNGAIVNTTGSFTLNAGRVITVGSGGGALEQNNTFTLTLGTANQLTGSGAFLKSGTGILTLSAAQNYSGAYSMNAGTNNLSAANALGSVASITLDGGRMEVNNAGSINDSAHVIVNNGAILDLNAINETVGSLTMAGGTVTNSSTAGILTLGGNVTNSASATATSVIGSGLALGASTRTFDIGDGSAATDMNIVGAITGTSVGIIKNGAGTLALGATNTFDGSFTQNAGTVNLNATNALGSVSSVVVDGGTMLATVNNAVNSSAALVVNTGGTFNLNGNNNTVASLTMGGGTVATGAGTLTLGGNVTNTASATTSTITGNLNVGGSTRTFEIADGAAASDMTVSAQLSGAGGLTKTGAGTLTLGANNSGWSGGVTVNAGAVAISADNNLGATAAGTTLNGGTLTVTSGFTSASRIYTLGASGGTFDIDASQTFTVSGANQVTGSGALTKTDSGTLALSSANNYSGGTVINGGKIVMSDRSSLGSGTLAISGGGELEAAFGNASDSTVGNISIASGTIRRTSSSAAKTGFLNGSSSLTITGTALLRDQGGDGAAGYLGFDGPVTVQNGGILTLDAATSNDEVRLAGTSAITINAGGKIATTGSGIVTLSGASARNLVGQGTATSGTESTLALGATGSYGTFLNVVVNGSGMGGLRIEGTEAAISSGASPFMTPTRWETLSGSGGVLTIAFTDNGYYEFVDAPLAPSSVMLGFDDVGGNAPEYAIGNTGDELSTFEGLVVKGGNVLVYADQTFTGDGVGAGTQLHMTGDGTPGTLDLLGQTLTFTGDGYFNGGTVDGGGFGGTKGTLKFFGNVYSTNTTFADSPNLTMAPSSGTNFITGSNPLAGMGDLTKTGGGTTEIRVAAEFNLVKIQDGTLLLGGNDLLTGTPNVRMEGGGAVLATGGYNESVGTLTMTANSIIDVGGSAGSVLNFVDSSGIVWSSGILTITNWSGIHTVGGGIDRVHFGTTSSGLTQSQVDKIKFINPYGLAPGTYDAIILSTGEVVPYVPVPEPSTMAGLALLAGLAGYRERSKLAKLWRNIRILGRIRAGGPASGDGN